MLMEVFMTCLLGCSDPQGLPVLEKLCVDGIGVVVVEDKDILLYA